ncbi:class I SAM-dependent rRNA methyltransferase [Methyloversatilis sp.]|uniref:class I SAM-dependent rRNA methyltransferase n=1 Tax=Methyloversatilis sp. TaxID=2569862 RepID=UPI0027B8B638|nr:class I SAM-dependent rRNA methyltransferase [Methyloversatilis sp.]
MTATLILAPGRERSVLRRHPWIFAGAVDRIDGRARPGDTVVVQASNGRALGRAALSPESQIRARMWTFVDESIDDAFFRRTVARAVEQRRDLPELTPEFGASGGVRLLHGESDGLPGVVADRYGDLIVLQITSAGGEKWRDAIADALTRATGITRIYERSDPDVRAFEGLAARTGWLTGEAGHEDGAMRPVISECAARGRINIEVDVANGHKTGFYLDQRDSRRLCGELAEGRRVLNCFCYTGGFSLHALAGGATEVLSIDSSGPALEMARANLAHNPGLDAGRATWLEADVFQHLRTLRAEGRKFDLVVLDPPKFAPSASHAKSAARAYKDINLLGLRLLAPGGLLMTYSCSAGIDPAMFQGIVGDAAADAGVGARVLRRLSAGVDHPVGLAFPEGEYLKGLLIRVA